MDEKARIIIADDHTIVRRLVRETIESNLDVEIVGEATNGQETVDLVEKLKPDILILDISMPYVNGLEVVQQLQSSENSTMILILTAIRDKNFTHAFLTDYTVAGFFHKDESLGALIKAIQSIHQGDESWLIERKEKQMQMMND